jgi:hypothetical protein
MTKRIFLSAFFVGAALITAAYAGASRGTALKPDPGFGPAPLYFISNRGQAAPEALFYAKAGGYTLWLTKRGLVFDRTSGPASNLIFKNASADVALSAADPADYRVSYFYGRDEADWITDIPTSRAVLYKNLYDGIDLKVYGNEKEIEYDWDVRPGADPARIQFASEGSPAPIIDAAGDLILNAASGELRHRKPAAYQVIAGRRVGVSASYESRGAGEYGFSVGAYDHSINLVIDPLVLVYSSYLGGYSSDLAESIAEDKTGAIYIAGCTKSMDFPPYHVSNPRNDFFVTKLSPDGQTLIYSDFFPVGLAATEVALAVDGKGSAYLVGSTSSRSFPVKNAFQTTNNGYNDVFFLKLTPNGKGLVFSSYLGGSQYETGMNIALDALGNVYIAGMTNSPDFPTRKAYQRTPGGNLDIFVSKFTPDGTSLVYSTYLGTSAYEDIGGLAVDDAGAAYIAGITENRKFPVKNAFQPKYGGGSRDCFITKLSYAGNQLVYSSFLGGSGSETCNGLAVDEAGAAYLTGLVSGPFPIKNAFQKSRKGSNDVFVTKVAPDGSSLVYSTYLGGAGSDGSAGIAVDGDGKAYVGGWTYSRNFPLKNAYQTGLKGSNDGFVTVFSPEGKSLISSTYLGGSYKEGCYAINLSADGKILVAGWTNSLDFPTLKPYQKSLKGDDDGFMLVFKLTAD